MFRVSGLRRFVIHFGDGFAHGGALAKVKISMDGRGRWIDNRMIERLWRSLKYECVYLNAFETGSETRKGIGAWISYYNENRPHSSHGVLTPAEAYDNTNQNLKAAA